ncbi:MAG: aldo/keto reductase [Candidatus Rokubacteria bacterium]|nr:aldo/keto reductase [Candidatus Rokubacteria bacterium]
MTGHATASGTERYAARLAKARVSAEHFRTLDDGLRASTLGIGTYLGNEDDATDAAYHAAITRALERGVNVIDTAINYRHQRSERAVGRALAEALERGIVSRDEVIVATKGGFIPLDAADERDPRTYFTDTYLRPGIVRPDDVVAGSHCMAPKYLDDQVERSLNNLGLDTIDVYYVHNPEMQLGEVERPEFNSRIREAFQALEAHVAAGRIVRYGTATWNGYRVDPGDREHLSLAEMVRAARDAGGPDHHFKVIQLPYNLAVTATDDFTQAFTRANQIVNGEAVTTLEAARRLGIYVMSSVPVYQGQLTRNLPPVLAEFLPGLETDAQRALQFVRSTPGIGTALVGMKTLAHVEENAAVGRETPVAWELFKRMFGEA